MFKITKKVNTSIILFQKKEGNIMLVFFKYFLIFDAVVFCIFSMLIVVSKLKIEIKNFNIQNIREEKNNKNFFIVVSFVILKFTWLKIKINRNIMASIYVKEKLKVEEQNIKVKKELEKTVNIFVDNQKIRKEFRKICITLEKLRLYISIGLEDCVTTSYLVGFIAIMLSNILPHIISKKLKETEINKKYEYKIVPIYQNKNLYKINLNCIITAKMVHIIYIIFLIKKEKKRRSDKNERTSNRKPYEYSYE